MFTQKQIPKVVTNCCEYTGGCERCNPYFPLYRIRSSRLTPSIEEIHKITAKIPQAVWDDARGKIPEGERSYGKNKRFYSQKFA